MRIISGKHRGRRIEPPRNIKARPTTDFAREGLFNLLQHNVEMEGITVLDLFAGTGAISYEFLSRGASEVTAVDIEGQHIKFMAKMKKILDEETFDIKRMDVKKYLATSGKSFDIVFADPPYEMDWLSEIPNLVLSKNMVTKNGLLIVEHGPETDLSETEGYLDHRVFGKVNFTFFKP